MIVAATTAGSYEERVYDMERGAWVACERCSGSGRVVATSTLR